MKDALGLEHMTMSDAEYEYEQLLKPVAMLTVRRRMGKTAMRLNLIAKIWLKLLQKIETAFANLQLDREEPSTKIVTAIYLKN